VMVEKGAASQPFVYFNHRHVFNDQSTPAPPPHLLCKGDYYAGGGGGQSWLKITSKQTAAVCTTKHTVVMSRRTQPKHDTAPVFLYIWHRIAFRKVSDRKNRGQKTTVKPGPGA
jgi:hypothetical protein